MQTITAKDLTKDFPRSPLAELGGYPWLARLIDKVRAKHAGTLGEYTPFPCGGDKRFLGTVGVDADGLEALIKGGATDEEVLAWVKAHQSAEALAAVPGYRAQMVAPIPADATEYQGYLREAIAELQQAKPGLDTSKVDNFTKLICLEEGHSCPGL